MTFAASVGQKGDWEKITEGQVVLTAGPRTTCPISTKSSIWSSRASTNCSLIGTPHARTRAVEYGAPLSIGADPGLFEGVLRNNEVHVWHADLDLKPNYVASLLELLDRDEQLRASRFKVPTAREQFVVSHAFLRLTLAQYLQIQPANIQFRITANGKPELIGGGNITFNLSHSDGAAALAITRERAVGFDVERIREDVEAIGLAGRFFSAREAQWLRSQPVSKRAAAFFTCWTAKEAFIKACGTGLSMPLSGFTIIPDTNEELQLETGSDQASESWSICQLNLGPHLRAALAVKGTDVTIRFGNWRWPRNGR